MRAGIERLDNKATCPICLRRITVDEARYLRKHNRRASRRKDQEPEVCPGSGTQPLDQGRLVDVPAAAPVILSVTQEEVTR